ncbi:MAG: hypothetical protein C5B43_02140 [Verrucomicrobia bacterium]|nr:MAG: hypothetical protein C5B43_02140 [Verrucomicrobiota bacterium]
MERVYTPILQNHLESHDQMIFLSGPRQSGKTTLTQEAKKWTNAFQYLNWDILEDREQIVGGLREILKELEAKTGLGMPKPILALDEIHKFKNWKNFLKGIFDKYKNDLNLLVTGSARLNIYKKGQDSLMGRYFLYRVHPFSIAEVLTPTVEDYDIRPPKKCDPSTMEALFEFGGFPEPFIKQDMKFFKKWQILRRQQLFREDVKDLSKVYESDLMEVLSSLLKHQAGQLLNYSNLANKIRVSDVTIRKWISILENLFYCFKVKPWHKNVARSLIKEPKIYLWDWSTIEDRGSKIENFVASHLLKAINFWTDTGLGDYGLFYLRDTQKREVDFLITKENKPWILVEVKSSPKDSLSPNLKIFQEQIKAPYAFQIAFDMDYIDYDFRDLKDPKILPVSTFLSQLI